jgi:hypothetical protein
MTRRSHNFSSIRGDVAVEPCVRSSDYALLCFTPASL